MKIINKIYLVSCQWSKNIDDSKLHGEYRLFACATTKVAKKKMNECISFIKENAIIEDVKDCGIEFNEEYLHIISDRENEISIFYNDTERNIFIEYTYIYYGMKVYRK